MANTGLTGAAAIRRLEQAGKNGEQVYVRNMLKVRGPIVITVINEAGKKEADTVWKLPYPYHMSGLFTSSLLSKSMDLRRALNTGVLALVDEAEAEIELNSKMAREDIVDYSKRFGIGTNIANTVEEAIQAAKQQEVEKAELIPVAEEAFSSFVTTVRLDLRQAEELAAEKGTTPDYSHIRLKLADAHSAGNVTAEDFAALSADITPAHGSLYERFRLLQGVEQEIIEAEIEDWAIAQRAEEEKRRAFPQPKPVSTTGLASIQS